MAGYGEQYWKELIEKTAKARSHQVVYKNSCFKTRNSRIAIFCTKCNTTTSNILLRSYLQLNSSSGGCSTCGGARFPYKPETLAKMQKTKQEKNSFGKPLLGKVGSLHPVFKENKTRVEGSPLFIQTIFALYNAKCFVTGKTKNETELQVHHLDSRNQFPEKVSEVDNGILISKKVHTEFHGIYGWGNNTREQFEEFLITKYNIKNFPWRGDQQQEVKLIQTRLTSFSDFEELNLLETIWEKGHQLVKYNNLENVYVNKSTSLTIKCVCCENPTEIVTTVENYKQALSGGLPCCLEKLAKTTSLKKQTNLSVKLEDRVKNTWQVCFDKIKANNHIFHGFSEGDSYKSRGAIIKIQCNCSQPTSGTIYKEISVKNYLRNAKGLPCCNKEGRDNQRLGISEKRIQFEKFQINSASNTLTPIETSPFKDCLSENVPFNDIPP